MGLHLGFQSFELGVEIVVCDNDVAEIEAMKTEREVNKREIVANKAEIKANKEEIKAMNTTMAKIKNKLAFVDTTFSKREFSMELQGHLKRQFGISQNPK